MRPPPPPPSHPLAAPPPPQPPSHACHYVLELITNFHFSSLPYFDITLFCQLIPTTLPCQFSSGGSSCQSGGGGGDTMHLREFFFYLCLTVGILQHEAIQQKKAE